MTTTTTILQSQNKPTFPTTCMHSLLSKPADYHCASPSVSIHSALCAEYVRDRCVCAEVYRNSSIAPTMISDLFRKHRKKSLDARSDSLQVDVTIHNVCTSITSLMHSAGRLSWYSARTSCKIAYMSSSFPPPDVISARCFNNRESSQSQR